MTVRMGFKCDSTINSNIMGTPGSEHLEQSGQMILKLNGLKKVQAPFLELSKAKQIVETYRIPKEDMTLQNHSQEEIPLFGVLETMRNRDKAILSNLKRFRCMSRDDIIDLHFQGLNNAVTCCNTVMKRLRRDGHVDANISQQPFIYFPQPSTLRKTSQKIPHFLGIVDVYKQLIHYEKPKLFKVEPKYGRDYMEPDAFAIWNRSPFFIEVQKSVYSKKIMQDKINRYELYFHSQEWHNESWQPKGSKFFPSILIITDKQYDINSSNLRIFKASSINNFMDSLATKI